MNGRHRTLRTVMLIDAWLSFSIPVVLIGCVPILALLEVPAAVVFAVVVVLAAVLGGCGLLMAGLLAWTMSRHDGEFPDDFAFRHFNLGGRGGTRGLHVPY